jgi:beta-galactosidase/beta-glucuronidase
MSSTRKPPVPLLALLNGGPRVQRHQHDQAGRAQRPRDPGHPTSTQLRREITFEPATYPQLHVANPALWWPYQFGSPELYQLAVTATVAGAASDTESGHRRRR